MMWISTEVRNPGSSGLYGVLINELIWNPHNFTLAYFDGIGWKLASQSDMNLAPYRNVKFWSRLEIGEDVKREPE